MYTFVSRRARAGNGYYYRHGEDGIRMQINDTGILAAYIPYDTRDPQVWKYLTSIG